MTNPSTFKPARRIDERRGDAAEGTADDRVIHYVSIPTTEEELRASTPPDNTRLSITKNSEAFDIVDGF